MTAGCRRSADPCAGRIRLDSPQGGRPFRGQGPFSISADIPRFSCNRKALIPRMRAFVIWIGFRGCPDSGTERTGSRQCLRTLSAEKSFDADRLCRGCPDSGTERTGSRQCPWGHPTRGSFGPDRLCRGCPSIGSKRVGSRQCPWGTPLEVGHLVLTDQLDAAGIESGSSCDGIVDTEDHVSVCGLFAAHESICAVNCALNSFGSLPSNASCSP